ITGCEVFGQQKLLIEKKSSKSVIRVIQTGHIRHLVLNTKGTNLIQSSMNMSNTFDPVDEYSSLFFTCLIWNDEPKAILILGLGAGIVPRLFRKYYPMIQIDIAEIDSNMYEMAKKYFHFKIDSKMNVFITDARKYVNSINVNYDIIFLDAFNENDEGTPFHLRTIEFLFKLKTILNNKTGVLVTNLHGSHKYYSNSRQTYSYVYKYNYAFKGQRNMN
ncbi:unnamed protein product, partial [Didymodactylos carnosus]